MKINWKVRFKNKTWVIAMIAAVSSLAIKLLVCFVENSFLFSALRLPVRLYVSLLFVFFFVQFSKVS
ncbi:phage holin [Listeria monocytogenes]|uniref:phage holin n=1 Tax=Listeria monocytogenes TaxID=1639 RepID=UPI00217CD0D4|nr:phage holin [Listeria monocytogenes]